MDLGEIFKFIKLNSDKLLTMNILPTGGFGFIGGHAAAALAEGNHQVVLPDNFSNCKIGVLNSLEKIIGKKPIFVNGDVCHTAMLEKLLVQHQLDLVIHFAGLKAVGDSSTNPINYYSHNVVSTISLIQAMQACGLTKLIFSSSATVYGDSVYLPYDELHPINQTYPYSRTKLQCEEILSDQVKASPNWSVDYLGYFNPVEVHPSGLTGEDPFG